ncbi:LysR family transcriptional regulator [Paenibacillus sp.]|uniref:LysR family transcriptional regulator n=1 Tax=Paenibacillus sp. TaxID=58172 RepID=UPI002811A2D2|nr:LysR family transcriptional regulator [Paenibacillus sp.]
MEIKQLESFLTVCDTLHFTRAAERLNTSQPTLSYQIRLLEQDLGVPLFDRIGKRVVLTEAGRILRKYGVDMFSALHGARNAIRDLEEAESGTLAIGTLYGEMNEWVSRMLIPFCREHPGIDIRLHAFQDVMEPLLRMDLDFAVTILPADDDRVETVPLYSEDFYAVTKKDSLLAAAGKVTFEELGKQSLVLFPQTHRCRKMIDKIGDGTGVTIRPKIETSAIESVFQLVEAGVGVSILSKTLLDLYLRDPLVAIPISEPSMRRQIGLVYWKERYRSKVAERFMTLLVRDANREARGTLTKSNP